MNRRRVCKYLLALMGAAWTVSGRIVRAQPPDQVVVPVPEDFTISLRVLKPDGTPLRRGLISILTLSTRGVEAGSSTSLVHPANPKQGALRVETDDEGRLITQLRARRGHYSFYVRAPGQGVAVVPLLEFEHKDPQFVEEVQVRLQPEGAVRVTVRDQKNVAMGGAHLFLVPVDADDMVDEKSRNNSSSLDWLLPVDDTRRVTRDGDGLLEMSGLRPGQYFATVSVPGYRVASPTPVRTISIKGGSITPLEFVLEPVSNAPLRLQIVDAAGAPLAGREVYITLQFDFAQKRQALPSQVATAILYTKNSLVFASDSYMERRGFTDKDGRLTLYPLMPGHWNVTLKDAAMDTAATAAADVTPGGGQATLKLGGPFNDGERSYDVLAAAAIVEK